MIKLITYYVYFSCFNPDFKHFPEPTTNELMNLVAAEIPTLWWCVGEGLGVKEADLKSIQADYTLHGQKRCFREVFSKWYSGETSEYSWQHLAEVLQSPAVNEQRLVKTLYDNLAAKNISSK